MSRRLKSVTLWGTPAVHEATLKYATEHGLTVSQTVLELIHDALCAASMPEDHPLFTAVHDQVKDLRRAGLRRYG